MAVDQKSVAEAVGLGFGVVVEVQRAVNVPLKARQGLDLHTVLDVRKHPRANEGIRVLGNCRG